MITSPPVRCSSLVMKWWALLWSGLEVSNFTTAGAWPPPGLDHRSHQCYEGHLEGKAGGELYLLVNRCYASSSVLILKLGDGSPAREPSGYPRVPWSTPHASAQAAGAAGRLLTQRLASHFSSYFDNYLPWYQNIQPNILYNPNDQYSPK